jgi:hypothetical protein
VTDTDLVVSKTVAEYASCFEDMLEQFHLSLKTFLPLSL